MAKFHIVRQRETSTAFALQSHAVNVRIKTTFVRNIGLPSRPTATTVQGSGGVIWSRSKVNIQPRLPTDASHTKPQVCCDSQIYLVFLLRTLLGQRSLH